MKSSLEQFGEHEISSKCIRRAKMEDEADKILFSNLSNDEITKEDLMNYNDEELEAFVRRRLGPFRFDFHAATAKSKAKNYYILALFDDIFKADDHYHTPVIHSYKGAIYVGPLFDDFFTFDSDSDFSGEGTVEILMYTLKKFLEKGNYFNAQPHNNKL